MRPQSAPVQGLRTDDEAVTEEPKNVLDAELEPGLDFGGGPVDLCGLAHLFKLLVRREGKPVGLLGGTLGYIPSIISL